MRDDEASARPSHLTWKEALAVVAAFLLLVMAAFSVEGRADAPSDAISKPRPAQGTSASRPIAR